MVEIRTKVLREIEWDCTSCSAVNVLYSKNADTIPTELWCSHCSSIYFLDETLTSSGVNYKVRLKC